jgi:hypothetical protein
LPPNSQEPNHQTVFINFHSGAQLRAILRYNPARMLAEPRRLS